jgi:hypothetical protein
MIHGDDIDLELSSIQEVENVTKGLVDYGFDVSVEKNLIATRFNPMSEFLKTVVI